MIALRSWPCLVIRVSWLLVAFIPGLLMLATFGLDRLEAGLSDGTASSLEVADLLEQAQADSARRAQARTETAQERTPPPVPALPLRETRWDTYFTPEPEPCLPTRVYVQHRPNPQFQQTRQADRV